MRSSAMTVWRSSLFVAADAELVALYLGLHSLGSFVAHQLGDLASLVGVETLLQRCRDDVLLARLLGIAGVQRLQRDRSLDQLFP